MGCDIHVFIEFRHQNGHWQADKHHTLEIDDGWEHVNQVSATGRCYELFGHLASVRGPGSREPLGIPEDLSPILRKAVERMGSDGHSHSYLSLEDFEKEVKRCDWYDFEDMDSNAFYNYTEYSWNGEDGKPKMPQDYVAMINYCKKVKTEMELVDEIILGEGARSNAECRIVFFFDN